MFFPAIEDIDGSLSRMDFSIAGEIIVVGTFQTSSLAPVSLPSSVMSAADEKMVVVTEE